MRPNPETQLGRRAVLDIVDGCKKFYDRDDSYCFMPYPDRLGICVELQRELFE